MLTTTQAAAALNLSPKGLAMTAKERAERARLHRLWATGKATRAQILRCMKLDRKANG